MFQTNLTSTGSGALALGSVALTAKIFVIAEKKTLTFDTKSSSCIQLPKQPTSIRYTLKVSESIFNTVSDLPSSEYYPVMNSPSLTNFAGTGTDN